MNVDNLVAMANHIGEFFEAMPDRVEAEKGISDHLRRFWAPRMRGALDAHLHGGAAGMSPIVCEALRSHSIVATPTPFDAGDLPAPAERHRLDGASES